MFMDPVLTRIIEELNRQHKDWQWFYTELGYTKQRVGGWKKRGVPPGEYEAIADVLEKSVDWVARGPSTYEPLTTAPQMGVASESPPYTVNPSSDKKTIRAPVVEWARLGIDLFRDNDEVVAKSHEAIPENAKPKRNTKWVEVEADMPRLMLARGDMVLITPISGPLEAKEMRVHLFRTVAGSYFLGTFRRLAKGFEAIPESGPSLESEKHGVEVVGIKHGHIEAL